MFSHIKINKKNSKNCLKIGILVFHFPYSKAETQGKNILDNDFHQNILFYWIKFPTQTLSTYCFVQIITYVTKYKIK